MSSTGFVGLFGESPNNKLKNICVASSGCINLPFVNIIGMKLTGSFV
jgi:hypothetical protein